MSRTGAIEIAADLRSHGFQAWLVGGCVRDLILGREPSDYDISTDARPEELLRLFPRAQLVGAQFGVVLVDGIEIATFRSDHSYADGRHPGRVVFETDPKQDVLRRDFTINALLLDPGLGLGIPRLPCLPKSWITSAAWPICAPASSAPSAIRSSALRKTICACCGPYVSRRASGSKSNPRLWRPSKNCTLRILRVSPERIRDELVRILTEGGARRGFELLDASGLLGDILPEVAAMKGVAQPPEFHPEGDVWTHTLIMLEGLQSPSPALALGVLLHDVGKPGTFRVADRIRFDGHVELGERIAREILNRLRFSNADVDQVIALIANHMRFSHVHQMRESTLKRMLRLPAFEEHLELHRLDCSSSHGHLDNYEFAKTKFEQSAPEELRPPRLVTGDDLIAAGYAPGPDFSRMLEVAEDAQLEARIQSKEEGLELVRSTFGPPARVF